MVPHAWDVGVTMTAQEHRATIPEDPEESGAPLLEIFVESMNGHDVPTQSFTSAEVFRIGAHHSNDLVLEDPHVSQFHCKLRAVGGAWTVEDLASRNGTRVNGVRIREAFLPLPSCRMHLGDSSIRVSAMGPQGSRATSESSSFGALRGRSLVMRRLFGLLEKIARTDATVLIQGESGTGKEVIATELVQRGPRRDGKLVIVDGGSLAPGVVESELFGHARGSFTGAEADRVGAFEAAQGGTLFFDEVGELPLEVQAKLLRALESRTIRRVGETKLRQIDVRVIAATNRSLEIEVNQRRFREDLFFRLSVVTVEVPPLRERLEDIPDLVSTFLQQQPADAVALFTPEVLADLASHQWPGNVRELRNYVERAIVLRATTPARLTTRRVTRPNVAGAVDLDVPFRAAKEVAVEAFDRTYLSALLDWAGGNVSQAARRAGMDRIHLHRLIQRYGLVAKPRTAPAAGA
jgi:transcriptional regulator with GAF, ATPase, and Fis domain